MTLPCTTVQHWKDSWLDDPTNDPLSPADENYISQQIPRASLLLENFIGRGDLTLREIVEGYDANGERDLILRSFPVQNIVSITDTYNSVVYDPVNDYILMRGGKYGIVRRKGSWRTGMVTQPWGPARWPYGGDPERLQVDYFAGYSVMPPDLEQSCIELLTIYFNRRKRGLTTDEERFGEYETDLSLREWVIQRIPGNILEVWRQYKDIVL